MQRACLIAVALVVLPGCGDPVSSPSQLAPAVYVRLAHDSIFAGDTVRLTAVATGEDSVAVAWPQFQWSSSDTSVARVDSTGTVLGWGVGIAYISARLGDQGDSIAVRVVPRDAGMGIAFASMATGERQLCALNVAGTAYCVPYVDGDDGIRFEMLEGADTLPLVSLAASRSHQCGVTREYILYCWGDNADGELMTGTTAPANGAALGGAGSRFLAVAAGGSSAASPAHTCGIEQGTGVVMCAGSNGNGQLGRVGVAAATTVAPVANGLIARRISAIAGRSCALSVPGELWCWGRGPSSTGPFMVSNQPAFAELSMRFDLVCALTDSGEAMCGSFSSTPSPIAGELRFSQILPGNSRHQLGGTVTIRGFICGVTTAGDLYCWGDFPPLAMSSRLGERRLAPVHLLPGVKFRGIGANEYHVCGVTANGELVCL